MLTQCLLEHVMVVMPHEPASLSLLEVAPGYLNSTSGVNPISSCNYMLFRNLFRLGQPFCLTPADL